MNSTWEYMVRKFIAHAWDEPSGAGTEVEGRSPHFPPRRPCFHSAGECNLPDVSWRPGLRPPGQHHDPFTEQKSVSSHLGLSQCNSGTAFLIRPGTGRRQRQLWNAALTSKYMCFYPFVYEDDRKRRRNKSSVPGECDAFSWKNWKRSVFRKLPSNTNKRVSQRRENILKLTDASSLCICYYLRRQGPLLRRSHCLATAILVTIRLIPRPCEPVALRRGEGQSCGLRLPPWWTKPPASSVTSAPSC